MADLVRVTIKGSLPGGEVWSVNPCFGFTTPLALSTDELVEAATAIDAITIPSILLVLNPASVAVTGCRVEARTLEGELEGVAEHTRSSSVPGTTSTAHPPQTSMVVSLLTADSTAKGKGRMYWPATGALMVNTNLRFGSSLPGDVLTGMNTYLADIRTALRGIGGMTTASLVVWSRTTSSKRVVTSMRIGDVPDVQRRRRDAMVEVYTSQAITEP